MVTADLLSSCSVSLLQRLSKVQQKGVSVDGTYYGDKVN